MAVEKYLLMANAWRSKFRYSYFVFCFFCLQELWISRGHLMGPPITWSLLTLWLRSTGLTFWWGPGRWTARTGARAPARGQAPPTTPKESSWTEGLQCREAAAEAGEEVSILSSLCINSELYWSTCNRGKQIIIFRICKRWKCIQQNWLGISRFQKPDKRSRLAL